MPLHSHLMPAMVPLARAFRQRGHEAVIATGPAMAHVEHTVVMRDVPAPSELGPPPPWVPERDGVLKAPLWSSPLVVASAANVLDFARTWRPDVVVRETSEYGGQIAAEVLGIPHALVDIAPFAPLEIPLLDELVDKVRARFGVGATEPALVAGLTPASWHPAQHHFRVPIEQGGEEGPEIVASFGTNAGWLMQGSRLPHVVVEALGEVAAPSVVAIGHGDWTGPRPSNVRLEPEIPQQRLLGTAKVFVTHAGYSGVREALTAGVPMVALPLFADQPRNADRVQELGAGVRVDVKGLTATVLAERIQHVLNARKYHEAAENLAAQMIDLEDFTTIPDHLVSAV
ncbi:glycosyltransferase [Lentzea sp. NEAU-D7]|uniref:glycosyltransferase n=1 Tax=Lentzea sp. NEAU-D7 TaxID=2994667 RepID=UPI00224A9483|nr:glycosyltransferase [Lentzea sp. NEAU-D7]MCX2947423.1 glycosyltransferase [Lentzea sp. NEAU-D7]